MKKSSKNRVIFRLENTCTSVIVRFGHEDEKCFVVEVRTPFHRLRCFQFSSSRDYESFIFENFGYMIIPSYQFIHEGSHLFVYR